MFYEQQERQKQQQQLLKTSSTHNSNNSAPSPSYEVSITTSSDSPLLPNSLMTQFIHPQLMSPPPNGATSAGVVSGVIAGAEDGDDEEFAGQTVTYVPLHQVASTFSEIVDVAGLLLLLLLLLPSSLK